VVPTRIAAHLFCAIHQGGYVKPRERLRGHDVATNVKTYARKAGLDPAQFSGHSLRPGFVTSAAETGATIFKIAEVSRHESADVLARAWQPRAARRALAGFPPARRMPSISLEAAVLSSIDALARGDTFILFLCVLVIPSVLDC
jgi:hypothetical protein